MNRRLQLWLVATMVVGSAPASFAQPPREVAQPADWSRAADAMFDQYFGETAEERAALEHVQISEREERRIGNRGVEDLLAAYRRRHVRVVERGRDAEYLAALVAKIRPHMQHAQRYPSIRVYVADTDERDARAFPGGSIVVTTGMIDCAETEAALVGVLGHELSHIDHGHQLRSARAAQLAQRGWDFRQASREEMQQRIMLMSRNFAKPYSAEDEASADRDGATWAFELGYEPLEMAKLFARLDERQPQTPTKMPSFLLTHPHNADRFAAVQKLSTDLKQQQPNAPLCLGRTNLKQRVPRDVQRLAD